MSELRSSLRDIKSVIEWELIRLSAIVDDEDCKPGDRRSIISIGNHVSDAVMGLARLIERIEKREERE